MKNFITALLLCFGVHAYAQDTLHIKIDKPEYKYKIAAVDQWQGISIFVSSTPLNKYEILGKVQVVLYTDFKDVQERLAEKAKEKYPSANAIIVDLNRSTPTGIVIKFTAGIEYND